MTEHEVIAAAAVAFEKRDALKAEMNAIEAEIAELVKHYSEAMRMWGFTPVMLRRAVEARTGQKFATW
jgi:predicted nucleic acid-binding protein